MVYKGYFWRSCWLRSYHDECTASRLDLRSQTSLSCVSSVVGDYMRSRSVVTFFFLNKFIFHLFFIIFIFLISNNSLFSQPLTFLLKNFFRIKGNQHYSIIFCSFKKNIDFITLKMWKLNLIFIFRSSLSLVLFFVRKKYKKTIL